MFSLQLPSLKLTFSHLKIGHRKRKLVFQPSIFRCYVSFREESHSGCIRLNTGGFKRPVLAASYRFSGRLEASFFSLRRDDDGK